MLTSQSNNRSQKNFRAGSFGYRCLGVLKAVFQPGRSRHNDKQSGQAHIFIYGKNTMKKYVEETFTLGRYVKTYHPTCRRPNDLTPEICDAFITYLVSRRLDSGTIGRYQAMIRKLDTAMRYTQRIPMDAPLLLPTIEQGGQAGFRSNRSTQAYTAEQVVDILEEIESHGSKLYGPTAVKVVRLMSLTGLRIQEAVYLREDNIDLEARRVRLEKNTNRTKGGKPRDTETFDDESLAQMRDLKELGQQCETGHLFVDRASLPNHVRAEIRRACRTLRITCLGSHAFRKYNAQKLYESLRGEGSDDETARRRVSRHLGHNRIRDTKESYVPPQDRSE